MHCNVNIHIHGYMDSTRHGNHLHIYFIGTLMYLRSSTHILCSNVKFYSSVLFSYFILIEFLLGQLTSIGLIFVKCNTQAFGINILYIYD